MKDSFQPLDSYFAYEIGDGTGIRITEEMRGYWRETARWTMVLSTFAMIVVSVLAIGFVLVLVNLKGSGGEALVSFLAILVFALFISVAYKIRISLDIFTRNIRKAADDNNQKSLESAYSNLLWYFKIMGILYLVGFVAILSSSFLLKNL